MQCPKCDNPKTYVADVREDEYYCVKRRRRCPECGYRFNTFEQLVQKGILKEKNK